MKKLKKKIKKQAPLFYTLYLYPPVTWKYVNFGKKIVKQYTIKVSPEGFFKLLTRQQETYNAVKQLYSKTT